MGESLLEIMNDVDVEDPESNTLAWWSAPIIEDTATETINVVFIDEDDGYPD